MDIPPELRWEMWLFDFYWIAPIVVGVICVGFVLYALKMYQPMTTMMLCFLMAVVEMGLGAWGTWKGGIAIYEVVGVAGDISVELMYEGWKYSWRPMIISGTVIAFLLLVAFKEWADWKNDTILE